MNALVAMSDQSSSGVGAVAFGGTLTAFFGVDLGRDPQLSVSNGRAFMIARDTDTVFELSRECGEPMCRWSTRREGRATNPQDVAAAPDGSLWIPRFNEATVAVIDREGREARTIALPDLDGDGNPNASAIRIVTVGGAAKAFVSLGLLEFQDAQHPFRSLRPSEIGRASCRERVLASV